MPSQTLRFTSRTGHELAARLDRPHGPVHAYALFAHCFTCSKDLFAAVRIAAALNERGIAVLRIDFTGLGESGGEFADSTFSSNIEDLLDAADYLRAHHRAPQILIGHSLGGAAVLAAAGRIDECRAVATIGAPADPAHVAHLFESSREIIEATGEAVVRLAGRRFTVRKTLLDDLSDQNQQARIAALRRPLLILHAPLDEIVGLDNARRIYEAALHPKSFVALDGADHLLTRHSDAEYVATVIAAWASRYLDAPAGLLPPPAPETGAVVVANTSAETFPHHVVVGPHVLRADEPVSVGGSDTGPTPYDLLSAALATCTSMTIRMYAARKGIALQTVEVSVAHGKIHAADCADCETREGRVDQFTRRIRLPQGLTEAQRQRLLEIADRCPVHRTLESEIRIVTSLHSDEPG